MNTVTGNNISTVTFSYQKVYIYICVVLTLQIFREENQKYLEKNFKHGVQKGW
jgi:hypothetical protein